MSKSKHETISDIVREMRNLGLLDEKSTDKIPRALQALGLRTYADRIEAAEKRKVDSIHRAMVIIAGIEMENSDYPPRLWTALEDAYDALSDALGTYGETTADEEEAKATVRHFVVKSYGNAAKMREALEAVVKVGYPHNFQKEAPHIRAYCYEITTAIKKCFAALSSSPRNCDVGTAEEQFKRFNKFCFPIKCRECKLYTEEELYDCIFRWAQMPYEKGGAE